MAEIREYSESLTEMARNIIESEPMFDHLLNMNIAVLESSLGKKNSSRITYGCCEKVQSKYKWAIDYDYIIVVYQSGLALDTKHLKRLLIHELLHVGENKVNDHDLQDFRYMVDTWGTDWIKN